MKYQLNENYIAHLNEMKEKCNYVENDAERRLNEQARGFKGYLCGLMRRKNKYIPSLEEFKKILVQWNNHTVAWHPEVIADIYNSIVPVKNS